LLSQHGASELNHEELQIGGNWVTSTQNKNNLAPSLNILAITINHNLSVLLFQVHFIMNVFWGIVCKTMFLKNYSN
jgi:hypothetical protein